MEIEQFLHKYCNYNEINEKGKMHVELQRFHAKV